MTETIEITPVSTPISGTIRPPGSKSLTNRALIVAALAEGTSTLTAALDSRDTQVMIDSLRRLGMSVDVADAGTTLTIKGCGGRPSADSAELWLENSGTSIRFLTALCTLGHGRFRLDGNKRMRERPIGDLVRALNALGAGVICDHGECPPLTIKANGLSGGTTKVASNISSQYLSALLMSAPCAQSPVRIEIEGELVSRPYVDMTLAVMREFGVDVTEAQPGAFDIPQTSYRSREYDIEPDASAASYFFSGSRHHRGHRHSRRTLS